ncbi:hypothetical protein EV426DRAFT_624815 [Tirmania nivea]|nr:hypothetical protein EV426DRAFT_624815 [Tirmania nivea]
MDGRSRGRNQKASNTQGLGLSNINTSASGKLTKKQRKSIIKNSHRREEKARRREEQTQKHISWALKATQAAIAVLCGYETGRNTYYGAQVKFSKFAAEVLKGNRETDMHDFFTVMGNINANRRGTMSLSPEEIRPLLRILGGIQTENFDDSYDDSDCGCESDCGYYRDKADSVFDRLSFADLVELSSYLSEHGLKLLQVSIQDRTSFAKPCSDYPDEQYISALRHVIDIILSAADPIPEEMSQRGNVKEWVKKLKCDSDGWWATHKFVVEMRVQVDDMMYGPFRKAFRKAFRKV